MKKVSVIGAGSFGTALAKTLADNGYQVHVWSQNESVVESINNTHINTRYLPSNTLPSSISCSSSFKEVLHNSELALFVVPSQAMREVSNKSKEYMPACIPIVHASKGFEIKTFQTMSEILSDTFPRHSVSVLSGPSHAEELINGFPTAVTIASSTLQDAEVVRSFFMNEYLRIYTSCDVRGVEVGGGLKNIFALGAGISDGIGYGDNAKAGILTRGLKEMMTVCLHKNGDPASLYGLSGIGDLIVTGTSKHSRNWRTGFLLGQGYSLPEALEKVGMVAEGVKATEAVYHFANEHALSMPITTEIYKVLYENKRPADAVSDLMNRDKRVE